MGHGVEQAPLAPLTPSAVAERLRKLLVCPRPCLRMPPAAQSVPLPVSPSLGQSACWAALADHMADHIQTISGLLSSDTGVHTTAAGAAALARVVAARLQRCPAPVATPKHPRRRFMSVARRLHTNSPDLSRFLAWGDYTVKSANVQKTFSF